MDRLTLAANLICSAPLFHTLVCAKMGHLRLETNVQGPHDKPEKVVEVMQLALDLADQFLELEAESAQAAQERLDKVTVASRRGALSPKVNEV